MLPKTLHITLVGILVAILKFSLAEHVVKGVEKDAVCLKTRKVSILNIVHRNVGWFYLGTS